MKHPLAITISSLAIFAFMALIIISGELSFSQPPAPTHRLDITSVVAHCPDSLRKDVASLPVDEPMSVWVRGLCDDKTDCEINTKEYYSSKPDTTPHCTEEIIIHYQCRHIDPLVDDNIIAMRPVFLYEHQYGAIGCSGQSDTIAGEAS